MKAKQQKIKEAYGENWEQVKDYVDENGYVYYPYVQLHDLNKLFGLLDLFDGTKLRPKSLQGIENNNGWIRIEIENDLPKSELDCHFVFKKNDIKYQTFGVYDLKLKSFWSGSLRINYVTHYQPIVKPDLPIY